MPEISSLQIAPSIDGRLRYGDAPEPSADVTASQAVPNDLYNPTGTAFSLAAATYFSGTQLGLGTYSFIPTIGTLAAIGLAFAAGSISGAAPTIGSVTGKFRWTNGSDANDFRDTNEFSISFIVPSFADTTAPTKVIGVTGSRSGPNVIIEHYPSSDPHDGVSAGSGIDRYEVVYDGLVVHTADTVAPEPSPEWQAADIGALDIPGESTRSGAAGSVKSSGFIGENAAPNQGIDKFRAARYALVSGDFRISVQVNSITQGNASTSLKFGLMLRDTLDPGSPFVFGQFRAGGAIRLESRAVQGGNRLTQGSGTIAMGSFGLLERIGNTVNFYAGSGGNDLGLVASVTRADIPQSFYVLLALCGTSDTGEAEATYDNFSLTQGAKINHTFDSTSAGPFTVRAVDGEDNVGEASLGITVAPATTSGLFPGTDIKLRSGFVIGAGIGTLRKTDYVSKLNTTNSRWYQFFTSSPNRSVTYRPPGVYGMVMGRTDPKELYTNTTVRPTDPYDHEDPGYDWQVVDAIFNLPCVLNDGALVFLDVREVGFGFNNWPAWFSNAIYKGLIGEPPSGDPQNRRTPCYHRYSGPDIRGLSDRGDSPKIVDEIIAMWTALRDHIVAMGWIDRMAFFGTTELWGYMTGALPADWNEVDFQHGVGIVRKAQQDLFAPYGIHGSSAGGGAAQLDVLWQYVGQTPGWGMDSPDVKLNNIGTWPETTRFTLGGVNQKDIRPLRHNTEGNGIRTVTYFPVGVDTPWTHSGVSVPQIAEHIVWLFCGPPKGSITDSSLLGLANGKPGSDPAGPRPAHIITPQWGVGIAGEPTLADWHRAFDIFGPPGTFAFPYLPEGFIP